MSMSFVQNDEILAKNPSFSNAVYKNRRFFGQNKQVSKGAYARRPCTGHERREYGIDWLLDYQEALRTPGICPLYASSLKQIRQMP